MKINHALFTLDQNVARVDELFEHIVHHQNKDCLRLVDDEVEEMRDLIKYLREKVT